jgi:phenylacetic acid degradation operon negative regulatory protein
MCGVNARSALFDLYGDHLLSRGEQAPVAALVRLLAPLGISAPAVRTAVSRMAGEGWLVSVRLPEGAGYRLTPRGTSRLRQAAARIYADPGGHCRVASGWDGRWHVVVVPHVGERARRDRLRSALGYLGYARLEGSTWVSPRQSAELESLLAAEQVRAERFHASYDGDPRDLAARAWDIDGLAHAYQRWLDQAGGLAGLAVPTADDGGRRDEAIFVARSELVHGWRKFLFIDPGLPAELLPSGWPGFVAAEFFDAQAARLLPAAARFVDRCLTGPAVGDGGGRQC